MRLYLLLSEYRSHKVFFSFRLGNNLAGQYKRGVGMALHIGIGNFSGAIGTLSPFRPFFFSLMLTGILASNIYRQRDAPRYILGRTSLLRCSHQSYRPMLIITCLDGLEFMFIGIGLITVPFAILTYLRINAQRKAALDRAGGTIDLSAKELQELGDRAPYFRYTL